MTSSAGEFINTEARCPIVEGRSSFTFCSEFARFPPKKPAKGGGAIKATGLRAKYKARQRGSGGQIPEYAFLALGYPRKAQMSRGAIRFRVLLKTEPSPASSYGNITGHLAMIFAEES